MTETPITSPHNEALKAIRRLGRASERAATGRFVAEGEDLLAAADAAGWGSLERYAAAGSGLPGREVDPDALAQVSALGSGTRTLAVYEQRWSAPAGPVTVYLHGLSDPGNVGTIIRAAHALGAQSVALGPGTADPYGPKAVRAAMGATFHVVLSRCEDAATLPGATLALAARQGDPIQDIAAALPRPLTLLIGAERDGLGAALLDTADHVAHIPIATESLNAAMAATIALYELASREGDGQSAPK